jgi:hypothetical protein
MSIYTDNGYKDRKDYLSHMAEDYGVPYKDVVLLASVLGPSEDFNGLVVALEDAESRAE